MQKWTSGQFSAEGICSQILGFSFKHLNVRFNKFIVFNIPLCLREKIGKMRLEREI